MKRYLWMLGVLWCVQVSQAQTDSLQAVQLLKHAISCLAEGKTDSATLLHRQALKKFEQLNLLGCWISSYADMGYAWADDAEQPFTGTALIEQGIAGMKRQPATKKEWESLTFAYIAAGHIRRVNANDFVGARDFYEQAFHIFKDELKEESDGIAEYLYHQLGNLYTQLGDYPRAENLLKGGVLYGHAHPKVGMADQGDLSIVLMETHQYEAALRIIYDGLGQRASQPDAVISMLQNEAVALHKLGKTTEALQRIRKVTGRIRKLSMEDDSLYYLMMNHITEAEILADQKYYTQAEALFHQGIAEGEAHWGTNEHREIGKVYCSLGALHYQLHNYQAALADFHQALQCVIREYRTKDYRELPTVSMINSENTILEALEGKALAFIALGQLESALKCYELIPVVGAKLIATHAYESSSLITLEEGRARFDQAVEIAWQLFQKTGQRSYAERAFALTEQARAVLMLQSIAKAQSEYQLPPETRRQEHELEAKIAWYEQQIAVEKQSAEGKSAARLKELSDALFQLKQAQQRFQEQLRHDYPEYARLSDQLHFLSVNEVFDLLRDGQALADYYLTDTDAYIFYFGKNGSFSLRKAALPPLFRDQVLRFTSFMSSNDENLEHKKWFQRMAYELYALLLKPELEGDQNTPNSLLIIPDDALVFIPFEVLLRRPVEEDAPWPGLPYLLDSMSTGYAYSATLLEMQHQISRRHRSKPAPRYPFAGFAPTYGPHAAPGTTRSVNIPDSLIYDIKSTQVELDQVQALMGGLPFKGPQANEQQFKTIAPDCGILLLAMHGLANDEQPELSCLLFGRPKGDSINNDVLFANELQIMQLQADLAVLSACHTGFGKLHKGEGVYSLARAFAIAGVPSTVMSIWRLHENTAPVLMAAFFKYLKAGKTKDEALQLSKKEFLKNDAHYESTHPFYWAGVTVNGDVCALHDSWNGLRWLGGVLIFLLLIALILWLRKRFSGK